MTDTHTKAQRSENMAAIRSIGNKSTELALISLFRQNKITGWRRYSKKTAGRPDFVFPKRKLAVFVDGCFWHGCKKHCIMPKSNKKYWGLKIARNKARDKIINRHYKNEGWRLLRIWEHEIRQSSRRAIQRIKAVYLKRRVKKT